MNSWITQGKLSLYLDIGIINWTAKGKVINWPLKWLCRSELVQKEDASDNNGYNDGDDNDNDDDDYCEYDDEDECDFDNDDNDHSKFIFHTFRRVYVGQPWCLLGILLNWYRAFSSYLIESSWFRKQTYMTYTIVVCTVKNSWWWTEELSETCRVLFQK